MTKYKILEKNIYNFNKMGFLMDQIDIIIIITNSDKIKNPKLAQSGNHEYIIIIIKVNS